MSIPELAAAQLIERLDAALDGQAARALTFDADGTLWSGDVAEDVFVHACDHELLRAEAAEALAREAERAGLPGAGSPSKVARRIFDAYVAGEYPELAVCEMMTWCFAGYAPAELSALADDVLEQCRLGARLHRELAPVLDWASRSGVRTFVISASPRPIVERAARHWGISPERVAASTPATEGDRIVTRLLTPVPYAHTKVQFGRALTGAESWLAAFGDSGFDGDMMLAASVRVAVRPKASLRERAHEISGLVRLSES